ncbi:hypothetical protein P3X46_004397 [Hevea brasiliensis]|uniref:Uncharacterized protein n=1 Tax=Hevea brasiliensis TaxID=3981 RepID=A0ABQ9MYH6_HEVBR|nr:hypothetical protein P3X46_004397 [Hevea brasiliensis]
MVLVHPYSKLGGCRGLIEGIALRLVFPTEGFPHQSPFDMRGVGRSTGRCSLAALAEIQDVIAFCRWISQSLPTAKKTGRPLLIFGVCHFEIEGPAYDARVADLIAGFVASLKLLAA